MASYNKLVEYDQKIMEFEKKNRNGTYISWAEIMDFVKIHSISFVKAYSLKILINVSEA